MIVTKNKVVSIDYTLTDDEKNVLDSTAGQPPLNYLHGFENIIPGLEKALEGKAEGEHLLVKIPALEAYGERDSRLVFDIPRKNFSGAENLEPGMQFQGNAPEGVRLFTIVSVNETDVTVDGNHPLAGIDLTFDVTITAVRDASDEEIKHGHLHANECGEDCGCDENCGNGEDCGCAGCGR
jgi:FKBP-type peptidyl-prolyl cis-trans isomerase SlyD